VDVFNNADRYEGYHDGVGYWDVNRSSYLDESDVYVSWRQPMMAPHPNAKKNLLWCHDLNYGPDAQGGFDQRWDVIAGVSEWHAGMLKRYYGVDATWVPNGINLERFEIGFGEVCTCGHTRGCRCGQCLRCVKKVPFRCVYASSADRGLVTLLQIWPHIVKAEPTAELHVAYGWETIDRMIQGGRPGLAEFKADVERLIANTPNVVWRGRLNQQDLAQLYGESVAWLYPTDFLEVSCISAMEALAAGCVPVSTACGALAGTVGGAGLLIPGPTTSRPYRGTFNRVALGVLTELNTQVTYSQMGRERAKAFTWDAAYQRWLEVLGYGGPAEPVKPKRQRRREMVLVNAR
jgi:glycosyltransferase involved in cell wall biosynthesis